MPLGTELPVHTLCFSATGAPQLESLADPFDKSVVSVRLDGRSCRIAWDAKLVTSEALRTAVSHVKSLRFSGPLTIRFSGGEWDMEETYHDHHAAFARIDETARTLGQPSGPSASPSSASPYRLEKAAFSDDLPSHPTSIDLTYQAWSRADGNITPAFLRELDGAGILQRAIILDYDEAQHGLVFRFVGWGHAKRFGHDWPVRAIGTRHDHGQPDDSYTRWIARQYDTAFEGDPRRDYIDSIIRIDSPGRSGRVQYERVLLPSRFLNGAPALVAVSIVRPGLLPLTAPSGQDPRATSAGPSTPRGETDPRE